LAVWAYTTKRYWVKLSHIDSRVGIPLHVDRMTASCRKISYARICIEVSAKEQLISNFNIEAFNAFGEPKIVNVRDDYQWIPTRCAKCQCFGHNCATRPNVNAKTKQQ